MNLTSVRAGDDAGRGPALRGDVVDVLRGGDGGGNRRGDKTLDEVRAGTRIGGRDRNDRFLDLRILPDGEVEHALEAEEQNQKPEDRRQNRPPDEECGEIH